MKNNKLSYLRPLFLFFMIGLILLTISRLIVFSIFKDQLIQVEGYMHLFVLGSKMDVILMSYLSFIPACILTFMPSSKRWYTTRIIAIYSGVVVFIMFLLELLTPVFISKYNTRPDLRLLDYLFSPSELLEVLLINPWYSLLYLLAILFFIWLIIKSAIFIFYVEESSSKARWIVFPLLMFGLFWGARGSLITAKPIDIAYVEFSESSLANTMGVSSFYNLLDCLGN